MRKVLSSLRPLHDCPPVVGYVQEAVAEDGQLAGFAAIQGDALYILPEAHQAIAEIGLVALLVEI